MVPESELDCRYSMLSCVSAASCDGMPPERELELRLSAVSCVSAASCDGMAPERAFELRSSSLTLPELSQLTPCHVEALPLHGFPISHPALVSHVAPPLEW